MAFLFTRLTVFRNATSRVVPLPSCALISTRRGRSDSSALLQELPANDDAAAIVDPLSYPDYFGVRNLVKLRDLYESRIHLGHKEGTRNEFMTPFIFGSRLGVDIIDLDQTKMLLGDALNFTAHIAYQGGIILFLSRNKQNSTMIESAAAEAGEYSHCRYWMGGVFTNAATQFGAVTRLPDLCIFINTLNNVFKQHTGVRDCAKMLIPSVGIVDTNCDPRLISYPVPGNDDTPVAVKYYLQLFVEAIKIGKSKRKQDDASEES